jgi:tetratricopeptide (TPR) repeat protein
VRSFVVLTIVAVLSRSAAVAQEHAHAPPERLGYVTFPVTCSPEARHCFERAMAVLHSFWWEEAPRAFAAVLAADSSCAMAHWGLAMAAWGNPFTGGPAGDARRAGAASAERAAALGGKTPREAGFIAAALALYRDGLGTYADTMARLYRDHPGDEEVAIYYALSLVTTAPRSDTAFASQKRAAAILNPLFARHPEHPGLAHYIIHANDSPRLAYLGLGAARRYAEIAPSAPHAQHMPSHIFIRLGLWDETINANQKAFDAGLGYARAMGLAGIPYEQFHALDYMVYGYLQQGEDNAARRVVATAQALTEIRVPTVIGGYNRVAMEARVPLERGDWARAAQLPLRGDSVALVTRGLSRFARAIGAARSGAREQATAEVHGLDSIATVLEFRKEPYWAGAIGIKGDAARAWLLFAAGDTTRALALAHAAADREDLTEKHPITPGELLPARELEADLHLAAGHYAAARAAYQATLIREPHRARSLFGAARAAELAGDRAAALAAYREYLAQMAHADGDRPEIPVARRFVH